jgi:hypothetical protein
VAQTCGNTESFTLTYGAGTTGTRITAPTTLQTTTFAAASTAAGGSASNLAPQPQVTVTGAASKLAFTTSPSSSPGGTVFTTQPAVAVQDAGGNTIIGDASPVTLAITSGTGTVGATLTCTTNPQAAVSGVATFAGCKIDKSGTYKLTATDGSLTSATTGNFTISVGSATKLAFTTSPNDSTPGTVFTPQQPAVTVQDAAGNTVNTSSPVTLAITTPNGAALTCTANPKAAVSGVTTFGGCKIDKAGTYTLTATATGLTSATSSTINITVAVANGAALTDTASDGAGSGVQTVAYYYCAGYSGSCSNGILIGSSTSSSGNYLVTWTGQPTNGQYRLVVVGKDNLNNVSQTSAPIPVTVSN